MTTRWRHYLLKEHSFRYFKKPIWNVKFTGWYSMELLLLELMTTPSDELSRVHRTYRTVKHAKIRISTLNLIQKIQIFYFWQKINLGFSLETGRTVFKLLQPLLSIYFNYSKQINVVKHHSWNSFQNLVCTKWPFQKFDLKILKMPEVLAVWKPALVFALLLSLLLLLHSSKHSVCHVTWK